VTTTLRSALKATGLRKSFGGKVVLDGIDLERVEGQPLGLRPGLGPDRALILR
jgi:ABC-2 type transport system ATP-binding protein